MVATSDPATETSITIDEDDPKKQTSKPTPEQDEIKEKSRLRMTSFSGFTKRATKE